MKCVKLCCFLLLGELVLAVLPDDEGKGHDQQDTSIVKDSDIEGTLATEATVKCIPSKVCLSNSDCNGGSCLGIALGKCNCGACATFVTCKDDSACGGLVGACNNQTGFCDCERGFKANGLKSIFTALTDVCNVKDCVPNTDSCFGLPCNTGVCACL